MSTEREPGRVPADRGQGEERGERKHQAKQALQRPLRTERDRTPRLRRLLPPRRVLEWRLPGQLRPDGRRQRDQLDHHQSRRKR